MKNNSYVNEAFTFHVNEFWLQFGLGRRTEQYVDVLMASHGGAFVCLCLACILVLFVHSCSCFVYLHRLIYSIWSGRHWCKIMVTVSISNFHVVSKTLNQLFIWLAFSTCRIVVWWGITTKHYDCRLDKGRKRDVKTEGILRHFCVFVLSSDQKSLSLGNNLFFLAIPTNDRIHVPPPSFRDRKSVV